ncbi:flagellar hook-associated protein FlgL [Jeotgalibacillus sp. R-1-5s-1]|uniref:flagellar hook-associated protein FlgL n=1 Tax=Jeotgalibacillus sp. R-1-5s-1 TaxID=2555897 RepID=UPI001069E656|nr:flagellar hook-associated protein FlgL [Jeotgalibacillus sp. R-1-5s-1]TFD95788.1 flagellar hook-associated protein 3 [Jeotgalibacillus sp. R-1-5s-1]
MRITQSMLSNNSLRHLSESYKRMQTYQDQLNTGKKITKPSQDPVVAMKGIRYRTEVTETRQYLERNLSQVYSWVENSDTSLDKVGATLSRMRELTVQASNDTYEANQRRAISDEVSQLIEHVGTITNTKVNNQYIFNGTDTITQPYNSEEVFVDHADYGTFAPEDIAIGYDGESYFYDGAGLYVGKDDPSKTIAFDGTNFVDQAGAVLEEDETILMQKNMLPSNNESVEIEIMKGISLGVNIRPQDVFTPAFFGDMKVLLNKLESGESNEELSPFLSKLDRHMDAFVAERANIGAKYNRVEMIETRLSEQEVTATRVMSENEDIDAERVIIDMLSEETLLRATLSTSARIIQPTLMDFLR